MAERFSKMKDYEGKELINIQSRSENLDARILSNLANTPFEYGGYNFKCVEAALQGIKFKDKNRREEVFAMSGRKALQAGREITNSIKDGEERFVYWDNKEIIYNSDEHRELLAEFIRAKIRQNKGVQKSLLKLLKKNFIYHYIGEESPHTSLPEKFYMQVLIEEGRKLQQEK